MAEKTYLRVRNWHRFQHYSDGRKPVWIKNYLELDERGHPFNKLSFADQGKLQAIWRLAARMDNLLPDDERFLANAIGAKRLSLGSLLADKWLTRGTQSELKREANAEKRAAQRQKPASKPVPQPYQKPSLEVKKEEVEPPKPPMFKCKTCGVEYRMKERLEQHMRNVHEGFPEAAPPPLDVRELLPEREGAAA